MTVAPLALMRFITPLDRGLAEVVGVGLHGQTEDADDAVFFGFCVIFVVLIVAVIACHLEYTIRDKILAGTIGFHDGLNQVLRHIRIIGQELLRILRQTIAAVAKAWIIVMAADTRIPGRRLR